MIRGLITFPSDLKKEIIYEESGVAIESKLDH